MEAHMLRFAPVAVLIAVAAPAVAQTAAPPPPPTANAAPKQNPLDKVICRTEDTVGSRLGAHRVCATLREWQDQEQENREALEKIQQGQGVVPSG
jgi:hypothetical protein